MKAAFRWFIFLLLSSLAVAANAQNCDAILKDGVFDTSGTASTKTELELLARHFCKSKSSSLDSNLVGQLSGITGSQGLSQQNSKKACENFERTRLLTQQDEQFFRTANQAIVSAWQACIGSRNELRFSLEQTADPKLVRGYVRFNSGASPAKEYALAVVAFSRAGIDPNSCDCLPTLDGNSDNLQQGLRIRIPNNGEQRFECDRISPFGVSASLNSTQGEASATLPTLAFSPKLIVEPSAFRNGGSCNSGDINAFAEDLLEATIHVHDAAPDSTITIWSVGSASNFGSRSLTLNDLSRPVEFDNVVLASAHGAEGQGLWLKLSDTEENVHLVEQRGNGSCRDLARGKINKLRLKLRTVNVL